VLFVPLWDRNALEAVRFQYVTLLLILANVAVYLLSPNGPFAQISVEDLVNLSVIPAQLVDSRLLGIFPIAAQEPQSGGIQVPEGLTLITYQFMHADHWHLLGNMLFLWVFGDNVEDAMGHLKFLVFYLLCGLFAGLLHVATHPASEANLIGASGSVAGVIAAYLMLHPNVRSWILVIWKLPIIFPMRLSAGFILGVWVLIQVVNALRGDNDGIAWWAHIGGLAAGALLVLFMRRPGVPLFDRAA
jgi:membrane associated rhomboid family serine protease